MFQKMICWISLTILISTNVYADDSVWLDKDQKAPFSGFLLPQEKIQEFRNTTIDRDTLKNLNDSYKTSLTLEKTNSGLKDNQITLLMNANDQLAKSAYTSREVSNWEKVGYFLGGILVTGLAIKGVQALRQ